MAEPSVPDSIKILKGLKPYFEEHHKVRYTNDAIKAAVELSARYMHDRKLPDKAIDVIDEVGASQMLLPESKRKKTVGVKEVESVISTMARIPPKSVSKTDTEKLESLETDLKRVVFGQDDAITALAAAIKLARAGLREPEKPIGSYLFSGLPGQAWARLRLRVSLRPSWVSSSFGSTCPSTWSAIRCRASLVRPQAMSALTRAVF